MSDLCTLSDVKAWLTIATGTTTDDALLGRLITATSLDFMNEIKRNDFVPAVDYTETREGDGGDTMNLRHWPINSIASVTIAGATLASNQYSVDMDLDSERRWEIYLKSPNLFTDLATVVIA